MKNKTLCFFDSCFGNKPPKQIWKLMKKIEKQSKISKCPIKIIVNKKQFQFLESECGVFSMWFLISRLRGDSCNYLFNKSTKIINDTTINKKRKKYFR